MWRNGERVGDCSVKVYTFVGMYDFVIENVRSFTCEAKAIKAWEDYTGGKWSEQLQTFENGDIDETIISYKHSGSTIVESKVDDYTL
jgi:hypothetical protein